MARFRTNRYTVKSLTKTIVNKIQTFFLDFWSKLLGNNNQKQSSMESSKLNSFDKASESNRTESMKPFRHNRKNMHLKHLKTNKYCHKIKTSSFSLYKTIFLKK